MARNSATVSADRQRRRRRAHGGDHAVSAEPAGAAAHRQHVDERRGERQRHHRHRQRHGGDAHREDFLRSDRRGENEIEIGARIEGPGHRLHRLRHHQQPRQQHGDGDADQHVPVERRRGEGADHRIGDGVHDDDEDGDADGHAAAALAPARGHHRKPIAPREPRFVPRKPHRGAGLDHCAESFTRPPARRPAPGRCLPGWRRRRCRSRHDRCRRPGGAAPRACLRPRACRGR